MNQGPRSKLIKAFARRGKAGFIVVPSGEAYPIPRRGMSQKPPSRPPASTESEEEGRVHV